MSHPDTRSSLARAVGWLCWVAVVVAAVGLLGTLLYKQMARVPDPLGWVGFMLATFTFHGGLLMLGVTAASLYARTHLAGWCALGLAVMMMGPTLWDARPKTGNIAPGTLTFTLATFNLRASNPTPEAAIATVFACDADIVFLQEYTPAVHELAVVKLGDRYRYAVTDPRAGFYGSAIFSRIPFEGGTYTLRADTPHPVPATQGAFAWHGQVIQLLNIHLHGPATKAQMLQAVGIHHAIYDLELDGVHAIVAGDFNLTQYSDEAGFWRDYCDYRDALEVAGRGLKTTWPRNHPAEFFLFPGVRIDHIYMTSQLTARRAWVADTPGSDHAHVVAEIGFDADPVANPFIDSVRSFRQHPDNSGPPLPPPTPPAPN